MADQADTRRMRLMDLLAASEEPQELESLAAVLRCDVRTIRRDLDQLQRVLERVHGIEVRRGKVLENFKEEVTALYGGKEESH